ncbi:hypothetical protein [Mycobacterium sp. NPDC050853]|uniref:hypothetical protein n=1 Tax=Mycobacterium sp. NPDC050853 TaxID=3155160 RepID=UPI0033CD726C
MVNETPSSGFIIGDDGQPLGHIDFDQLTLDATLLMYELAVTAGDNDATDRVAAKWVAAHNPDYYGYLCAAALSLTVRHVLAPTLDVTERLGVDLRIGLRRAATEAARDLGGGH